MVLPIRRRRQERRDNNVLFKLVAENATKEQVTAFMTSFFGNNYFHACIIEIMPISTNPETYTITLTPHPLGNKNMAPFMQKEILPAKEGWVSGGLEFTMRVLTKEEDLRLRKLNPGLCWWK